ncbi:MAG: 3-hydroxyacyl-CoA dehydrogenase NAD-binding domain-containing protein, partial [Candidatus Zixiibacteriota bacterium]
MAIDKIVIVGAGTMGQGIARTIAETGTEVILYDLNEEILKKSLDFLSDSLDREIEKWGITKSEKKAILSRIKGSTDINKVKLARVVFEAIPENLEMKRELFGKLDNLCPPETVFISNTSTLSISQLASATKRPEKFIGMHFLNP